MPYLPLSFLLSLASALLISGAASGFSDPHAGHSFTLGLIQNAATCPYTVIISTSCFSPDFTKDEISIAFGDSDGNQVFVPRLDDPTAATFEKCSSETFQLTGPCINKICYVYLHREGIDGWIPEYVSIFRENSKAVKFNINTTIPENTWFGANYCNNTSPPSPPYLPPFTPQSPPPPSPTPPTPASVPPPKAPPPPSHSSSYRQSFDLGIAVLACLGWALVSSLA